MKFTRTVTHDSILQEICNKDMSYKGTKIQILKNIQWIVREQRKEYNFLTKLLSKNNIMYKWLFPEGKGNWEGKTMRLASIYKAYEFAKDNAQKLGYEPPPRTPTYPEDKEPAEDHSSVQEFGVVGGVLLPPRALRHRTGDKKYTV